MLASSLSIYRGYTAHGGMGEQPSDARGKMHGEQYLYADDELWNAPGLTNQVRIWMTLYDDQRIAGISYKLGANIEAWSYFDYGDLRFVTRLISGGEFGPRLAYFSHCRAWRAEAFKEGDDPGAFLGQSKAFADQWKEGQESGNSLPQPSMKMWRQVIGSNPSNTYAAIRLVAQLYRAVVTGCPVVLGAPYGEFVIGSRLHQLVSFARAALPMAVKQNCRIRIFTGRPEVFLRELKAHLVAIPEEMASHALTGRPDAALLDMDCKRRAGPEADQGYEGYARQVVDRALSLEDYPNSLFAFTSRVAFPPDRMPSDAEVDNVPRIYHLVADPKNQSLMDGLLDHFSKESVKPGVPPDWEKIIDRHDWRCFSQPKLTSFALRLAETPGVGTLIQGAREELARRGVSLDREADAWLAGLSKKQKSEETLALAKLKLISRTLPDAEDLSPRQLSELLDNKELAGEVLSRGEISDETAVAASKTSDDIGRLILLVKDRADCRRNLDKVIRMLAAREEMPAGLNGSDLTTLPAPDPNAEGELENYLSWAEVLDRAKLKEGKRRIDALETYLLSIAARRRLFEALESDRWKALKEFAFPESWDNDLRDRLLSSDQQLRRIGTRRMLGLLGPQQKQKMPINVVRLLDENIKADVKGTTDSLVKANCWLFWRWAKPDTLFPEAPFHKCAIQWLSAPKRNPDLEEWQQVMLDLGQISAEDIRQLRSQPQGGKLPWPEIPLYEDKQLADLVNLCPADLGVGAELAEALGSGNEAYGRVLEYFQMKHDIPSTISTRALQCLISPEKNNPTPGLQEASSLVSFTTHRRSNALDVLVSAVFQSLSESVDEAEKAANDFKIWELLGERFASWLSKHPLSVAEPKDLSALVMLERHVQDSWAVMSNPSSELQKRAESYARKGLMRLAGILCSDLYRKLVFALIRNSATDPLWNKLLQEIQNCKGINVKQHPLMLLCQRVAELTPEQQIGLDQNGWNTFKRVWSSQQFSLTLRSDALLPMLSLATALQPRAGLGEVAAQILRLQDVSGHDTAWWKVFFESMESCKRTPGMGRVTDRLGVAWVVVARAMRELPAIPYKGLEELKKRVRINIAA